MKKLKRIGALILVILLIGLSILTLISAFFATPETSALFNASMFTMVTIPFFIFAYMLIYRVIKKNNNSNETDKNKKF